MLINIEFFLSSIEIIYRLFLTDTNLLNKYKHGANSDFRKSITPILNGKDLENYEALYSNLNDYLMELIQKYSIVMIRHLETDLF